MQSPYFAELEQTYRLLVPHSEYSGVIVWVYEKTEQVVMSYMVARDGAGDTFPDVVFLAFTMAAD